MVAAVTILNAEFAVRGDLLSAASAAALVRSNMFPPAAACCGAERGVRLLALGPLRPGVRGLGERSFEEEEEEEEDEGDACAAERREGGVASE